MSESLRAADRPNVVFIVADDLGSADLGCYGGRPAEFGNVSPELDALAASGIRFTQGYANAPVGSPTRFALMTGRYQYRLRGAAEEPLGGRARGSEMLGLPPAHPTLASLLRAAGYATSLIGKWHLGYPPNFGPLRSGYQEFFGSLSGSVDYFSHRDQHGNYDLWQNQRPANATGYLTDLLTDRAVQTIDRAAEAGQPLFLSLHYTAPQAPWEARGDEARAYQVGPNLLDLQGGNVNTYRSMIHHMDEGVGRVRRALERNGLLHNTLIIFTSDNGGERFSDSWPLVGGKMDLTEGGIRVPWIAHWPAVIAPARVSRQHCMTMDWTATVLDAAGVAPHKDYPMDGVSLLGVLRGEPEFERNMYWRTKHRGQRASRLGDWKYLQIDGYAYLFDLSHDERERANLAMHDPGRLADMRRDWLRWNASMPVIPVDAAGGLGYSQRHMPQR